MRVIHQEIPIDENGKPLYSTEIISYYHNKVEEILQEDGNEDIRVITTPTKLSSLSEDVFVDSIRLNDDMLKEVLGENMLKD